MKNKKFALLALLVALMMVFAVVLAACQDHKCTSECPECGKCTNKDCNEEACKDKCNGHEEDGPAYTGQFTYTRIEEGAPTQYNDMVLNDDGSFYLQIFYTQEYVYGTYEYNADKTKITFTAENNEHFNKTCDVEVNDAGLVVIKQFTTWTWDGTEWYTDDYVYNTTRPALPEPIITIAKFFIEEDPDAKLELFRSGMYELKVTEPKIVSSGTYTTSKSGNTTTYTLTDDVNGNNAVYTFTATYTDADGYSNMILKGTGIDAAGIEFTDVDPNAEREVLMAYTGKASSNAFGKDYEEVVTLRYYSQTEVELEFTIMNGDEYSSTNIVAGTATVAFPSITFTWDDSNPAAGSIKSVIGTIDMTDPTNPVTTFEATIAVAAMGDYEYTASLTVVVAEREPLMTASGTVGTNFYGQEATETVTIRYYEGNEFELEFTTMGAYPAVVSGTYTEDYGAKTITFTVTDGEGKDCVTSISGIFDDSWSTVISITITTQAGAYDVVITIAAAM